MREKEKEEKIKQTKQTTEHKDYRQWIRHWTIGSTTNRLSEVLTTHTYESYTYLQT